MQQNNHKNLVFCYLLSKNIWGAIGYKLIKLMGFGTSIKVFKGFKNIKECHVSFISEPHSGFY